ncbi:MAG: leucyl aminopeptidase [Tumebacillaceae bacterium]
MKLTVHTKLDWKTVDPVESMLLFYPQGEALPEELAELNQLLGGELDAMFADGELKGKAGAVSHVRTNGRIGAKHLYLVGLGEAAKLNGETVRQAAGNAARQVRGESVGVVLSADEHAIPAFEGLLLGSYTWSGKKTTPADNKTFTAITVFAKEDVSASVQAAKIQADAVIMARDLINEPANLLTPVTFAEKAQEVGAAAGLTVDVLDEHAIQEKSMNLLWAVGKGSEIPPRLVVLRYQGAPESQETLALVGKGVTFDTGGYILKPEAGMGEMKTDMAGAACVLGAVKAIAEKQLPINVMAVLALAENMISGSAFKPSDVATAFNGKTVELIDTDCEGRLVLADAVAYAKHLGATRIVDTATLTGAVTTVLGYEAASLFGNNDEFLEEVKAAGAEVGEKLWVLPNYPEYQSLIESKEADYINYSGRNAGAIAGGVFIAAFADDVPFVHIDMANMSRAKATKNYQVEGGTAFSTRTLIQVAERLAQTNK